MGPCKHEFRIAVLANSPDSALITVVNAAPNSQNATFSAPVPE